MKMIRLSAVGLLVLLLLPIGCSQKTPEVLYSEAVEDARSADPEEILPLVTLTPDNKLVTWSEDRESVLLLSWHDCPESYIAGEAFTCTNGEIWAFTDKEILARYDENAPDVTDWTLRLEQLIGLPPDTEYTHVSAFWVELDEISRPAYQTDATKQMSKELLDGSALGDLRDWFEANAAYSYSENTPYPWTRLGYTYDWADNGTEYGLTEFLILADSVIEVEWTVSTEEFIDWLAAN